MWFISYRIAFDKSHEKTEMSAKEAMNALGTAPSVQKMLMPMLKKQ